MKKIVLFTLLCLSLLNAKEIKIDLDAAIRQALENNGLNKIAKINLEIAQAQYEQAISANYPSLDAILYANRDKNDTIYQQRGVFSLPANMANALAAVNGGQPLNTIPANIDAKARGRDTVRGSLEVNYPLYTGGKIEALINQAKLNKELARATITRAENDVIYDVRKYYYGYILTNELHKLVNKIYKNMKFSTNLAKEFLENSTTLKINRTDYLNAKLTTSLIQSTLTKIELNRDLLKGAISNLIGLKWDDEIIIEYKENEILNQNIPLQKLIENAYDLNPDISKVNLAVKIKEEQINEANSAYYPQVGVFGNVSRTYNLNFRT